MKHFSVNNYIVNIIFNMNNATFIKEARFERQSINDWSANNLKDRYKICESVGHGKYGYIIIF